jgi:Ca2+/Na+ antiporter
MPEITNSIISSVMGQSQIGIGNLIGSSITILTLVTAIIILFVGPIEVDRKNVAVLGISAIIGILIAYSIIEKGFISRLNGGYCVIYFVLLNFLNSKVNKKGIFMKQSISDFFKIQIDENCFF